MCFIIIHINFSFVFIYHPCSKSSIAEGKPMLQTTPINYGRFKSSKSSKPFLQNQGNSTDFNRNLSLWSVSNNSFCQLKSAKPFVTATILRQGFNVVPLNWFKLSRTDASFSNLKMMSATFKLFTKFCSK